MNVVEQTLIGIDYGTVYSGIAVKPADVNIALPLEQINMSTGQDFFLSRLKKLCEEYRCDAIILGKPLSMDGGENSMTEMMAQVADLIMTQLDIPVHEVDERLTTKAGGSHEQAAALILQSYIDRHA